MNLTTTLSYEARERSFWTLMSLIALCLVAYVYAVNATVHNTVARVAVEQSLSGISSKIGEMEFSYIGEKNTISLELAYARGFETVAAPVYISRSAAHSLSYNSRR